MKIIEPKFSPNAQSIIQKRYLLKNETPGQMFWRVSRYLAKAEINWGENGVVEETAEKFYERLVNLKFMIAGRALFEAGNPEGTGQLSSCFVLPVEDNIQSIFKTLGNAAVVHKNNGGTGFNFSHIRMRRDKVKNVPHAASGPVDFLSAYSAALGKILQGSKRQGANIGILNINHADILDFITLKDEDGTIKNFNLSVGISNEFMQAVEEDQFWELKNPRNCQVIQKIKARKLFDLIAEHAHQTGDPGLAFLDRMEEDNPTPSLGKIEATNPCGEIPLLPYESCNLASIVLNNHLEKTKNGNFEINWEDLAKSIKLAVRLLDDMIEVNNYPLPEIENMVKNGNRRIGLGVMGFAHLLFKLKIPYASNEAVRLSSRLAKFIRTKAEEASLELAQKRGVFPNWDQSIYAGSAERYRNCAFTMIAPTGSISILADCSSGIEPVFSLITKRKTFFEDDKNNKPTKEMLFIDPVFDQFLIDKGFSNSQKEKILQEISEGNFDEVTSLTKEEKKIFATSHQISPTWHIKIQSAWQKHFDNSVSKTINFPGEAKVEDVKQAYMLAWRLGCKGITIYRDGSKIDQVLNLTSEKKQKNIPLEKDIKQSYPESISNNANINSCPECGAELTQTEGCATCYQCGWSKCKL